MLGRLLTRRDADVELPNFVSWALNAGASAGSDPNAVFLLPGDWKPVASVNM